MLGRIALFELRYQLRRPIALISFIVFAALAVGLQSVIALAGGALFVNAPSVIAQQLGIFSIVAMFLSLAVLADVALRDAATRMDPIMRSMPVRAGWYFGARFVGAYAVACLGFLGVVLGNSLAAVMPWIPASAVGPFRPAAYIVALAVIALPNLLVTGALFFSIAMFTRSLLATYLAALAFFIAYIGAQMLVASPDHRVLAALLDPFGVVALRSDIAYWTLLERNTWSIPLSGLLLWNRLVWIGIGLALLALSLTLFSARDRRPRSADVELAKAASSPIMRERPALAAGGAGAWDQFLVRTRYETGTILRSWTFFVLLALSVLASIGALLVRNYFVAMPSMPVTYVVVDIVAVAFAFVALLVPIAYGGELLWRERAVKIAEIIDATPTPTAVFFLAKLVAVALVLLLLLVVDHGRWHRVPAGERHHRHRFRLLSGQDAAHGRAAGADVRRAGHADPDRSEPEVHRPADRAGGGARGGLRARHRHRQLSAQAVRAARSSAVRPQPLRPLPRPRALVRRLLDLRDRAGRRGHLSHLAARHRLALDPRQARPSGDYARRRLGGRRGARRHRRVRRLYLLEHPHPQRICRNLRPRAAPGRLRGGVPQLRGAAAAAHHRDRHGDRSISRPAGLPLARPLHARQPRRRADRNRPGDVRHGQDRPGRAAGGRCGRAAASLQPCRVPRAHADRARRDPHADLHHLRHQARLRGRQRRQPRSSTTAHSRTAPI